MLSNPKIRGVAAGFLWKSSRPPALSCAILYLEHENLRCSGRIQYMALLYLLWVPVPSLFAESNPLNGLSSGILATYICQLHIPQL